MPIRPSIDRFEGDRKRIAVLVTEDGQQINVPKALLPRGAKAGDVLAVTIERDEAATRETVERTKQVQAELKNRDPGGDRGRKGGRPRSLDATKLAQARSLHKDPANTIAAICATLGISRATFYRHLASPAEEAGADGHRGESLRAERRSVKRSRPGRSRAKGAK